VKDMKNKLIELCNNCYSPYFNFNVAAIITMKDGKEINGVNVENANGTSICAERTAIGNAVTQGYKKGDFKEIHILSNSIDKIITPCFACRQVLLEFIELDAKVICMSKSGEEKIFELKELCPHTFTSEDLN